MTPPPLLGKFPTYSRFSSRQVACKIGWEPFWHAKNNLVNRHQEVGLGQTPLPPPRFPHNPVFFSDRVPKKLCTYIMLFEEEKNVEFRHLSREKIDFAPL